MPSFLSCWGSFEARGELVVVVDDRVVVVDGGCAGTDGGDMAMSGGL